MLPKTTEVAVSEARREATKMGGQETAAKQHGNSVRYGICASAGA